MDNKAQVSFEYLLMAIFGIVLATIAALLIQGIDGIALTAKHKIENTKKISPIIMALFIKFIFPNFAFIAKAFIFAISHSVEADLLIKYLKDFFLYLIAITLGSKYRYSERLIKSSIPIPNAIINANVLKKIGYKIQ